MAEILAHLHGGPLAGMHRVCDAPDRLEVRIGGRTVVYRRDETSAGGRCYDFVEAR